MESQAAQTARANYVQVCPGCMGNGEHWVACPNFGKPCTPWPLPTFTMTSTQVPYKCPCCDGWGTRPGYEEPGKTTTAGPQPITCHACGGTGVVWK